MKIKIWETDADERGFMYSIWLDENADEDEDCDDGGICTGRYEDAVEMACSNALDLLNLLKQRKLKPADLVGVLEGKMLKNGKKYPVTKSKRRSAKNTQL